MQSSESERTYNRLYTPIFLQGEQKVNDKRPPSISPSPSGSATSINRGLVIRHDVWIHRSGLPSDILSASLHSVSLGREKKIIIKMWFSVQVLGQGDRWYWGARQYFCWKRPNPRHLMDGWLARQTHVSGQWSDQLTGYRFSDGAYFSANGVCL